jgi:hypothetical protein
MDNVHNVNHCINIPSSRAFGFYVYLFSCAFVKGAVKIYVSLVGQSLIPDRDCNYIGTTPESCEQWEFLSSTRGSTQNCIDHAIKSSVNTNNA